MENIEVYVESERASNLRVLSALVFSIPLWVLTAGGEMDWYKNIRDKLISNTESRIGVIKTRDSPVSVQEKVAKVLNMYSPTKALDYFPSDSKDDNFFVGLRHITCGCGGYYSTRHFIHIKVAGRTWPWINKNAEELDQILLGNVPEYHSLKKQSKPT